MFWGSRILLKHSNKRMKNEPFPYHIETTVYISFQRIASMYKVALRWSRGYKTRFKKALHKSGHLTGSAVWRCKKGKVDKNKLQIMCQFLTKSSVFSKIVLIIITSNITLQDISTIYNSMKGNGNVHSSSNLISYCYRQSNIEKSRNVSVQKTKI